MPRYFIKPRPETDLYILWSTVTDAPAWAGTREEATSSNHQGVFDYGLRDMDRLNKSLDQADLYGADGVSVHRDGIARPWIGGWDDEGLLVQDWWTNYGFRWLPRSKLHKFAELYQANRLKEMMELTEKLPDEDEEKVTNV